jgi:hypothetical protein
MLLSRCPHPDRLNTGRSRILAVLSTLTVGLAATVTTNAATAQASSWPVGHRPASIIQGEARDGNPLARPGGTSVIVPDGLPAVAHARVSIPGLHLSTTTDRRGDFTLAVPAADARRAVSITVTAAGYGTWRETGVRLAPAGPTGIYVQLQRAAQSFAAPRPGRQPYNGPAASGPKARQAASGQPDAYTECGHNSSGWTSQKQEPPTIRVYLTGSGTVVKYSYTFYEEHVLPNEWGGSAPEAALQAGAEAVRDYAWYFVLHGSKGTAADVDPCSFDVDDTTAYQDFVPGAPTYPSTDDAVTSTAGTVFSHGGTITETSYCSNFATDCGADSPPDSCGEDANGTAMSQIGSDSCANDGDTWQKILSIYYYPGYTLRSTGSGGGVSAASPAVYNPGSSHLEVYGTGTSGALEESYYRTGTGPGTGWTTWQPVDPTGASVTGVPAAIYDPINGNLEVYAATTKGQLAEYYWNSTTGWHTANLKGAITASPTAIYNKTSGNLEVYAHSTSGKLAEIYYNGTAWSKWQQPHAATAITSSPAAVYDPISSNLEVYAATTSGKLAEFYWNTTGWHTTTITSFSPLVSSKPSAIYDPATNYLEVYAQTQSGQLAEFYWNTSWHHANLKGAITTSPAAVYNQANDNLEVYARGNGGTLNEIYHTASGWSKWQITKATITGSPYAVYDTSTGNLEVYWLTGHTVSERYWNTTGWHTANLHGNLSAL